MVAPFYDIVQSAAMPNFSFLSWWLICGGGIPFFRQPFKTFTPAGR